MIFERVSYQNQWDTTTKNPTKTTRVSVTHDKYPHLFFHHKNPFCDEHVNIPLYEAIDRGIEYTRLTVWQK